MEGHVTRLPVLGVLLAVLGVLPVQAQVAGRWKLTLDNPSGIPVHGELVLPDPSGSASGRLLLENRDSSWLAVRNVQTDATGTVSFGSVPGAQFRFEGKLVNDGLEGIVAVQGEGRYRWRGVRLKPDEEYYAALPRFRQRQIRIGSVRPNIVIPGRWLAAAAAMGEDPESNRAGYTELSLRAGLTPLTPDSLARFGLFRAMGLFRRPEMTQAAVATLERIRSNLQNDTAVARFDHLFRPGGRWQIDVHDVALARSRRPFPTLQWESLRPVLQASGLLDSDKPGVDVIPLALYRLYVLSRNDSAAYQVIEQTLRQSDGNGAALVISLVGSYEEASQWYVTALRFLLEERWIRTGTDRRSLAGLVGETWRTPVEAPEIRSRLYGYPEGAVRVGTTPRLVAAVLRAENATARDWLERHGPETLLSVVHRLSLPYDERTRLTAAGDEFRLSSVQQYARESFSGFLEPRDIILLDPSYEPLLALGTLIHEWQHILQEHARQADSVNGAYRVGSDQLTMTQLDPYLAEGFAEWLTEEILVPALGDFPLLAFGEAEKRVSLPQNDTHQLGYLMVRALARTLGNADATRQLLTRSVTDPLLILRDSRIGRSWSAYRGPDRTMARRTDPVLLPQAVFTIEDGEPDLVQSQIIAPYIPPP